MVRTLARLLLPGRDRGSVTLFLSISVVGLLVLGGLAVDGAAKVRAVQRADRIAAEAARAAGQALDVAAVLQGSDVRVDRRRALDAAHAYLASTGVDGSATVTSGGDAISVRTTISVATALLGLVGVDTFTVQGHAEAALVHSVRGVVP